MKDVKKLTHELGEAIKEQPEFVAYEAAKAAYDADEALQNMVEEFNLKRMNIIQEMQKPDKDEQKVATMQAELRDFYEQVNSNENMIVFTKAQDEIEKLVNDVYAIINFYVTGQDPDACTHDCSTCGGCH